MIQLFFPQWFKSVYSICQIIYFANLLFYVVSLQYYNNQLACLNYTVEENGFCLVQKDDQLFYWKLTPVLLLQIENYYAESKGFYTSCIVT